MTLYVFVVAVLGGSDRLNFDLATIIGLAVCAALIVLIIVIVIIICYRRNQRQHHQQRTTQNHGQTQCHLPAAKEDARSDMDQPPVYTPTCPHYNNINDVSCSCGHYHRPDHCTMAKCDHHQGPSIMSTILTPPPYNSIILTNEHCQVDPIKLPNNDETATEKASFIRCSTCHHENVIPSPASGPPTSCNTATANVPNTVEHDALLDPSVRPACVDSDISHTVDVPSLSEGEALTLPIPVVPSAPPIDDNLIV